MGDNENIISVSTAKDIPGITSGMGIEVYLGSKRVDHVISVDIDEIGADSLVMATIRVAVRLGR
jgi:hypothetical protein